MLVEKMPEIIAAAAGQLANANVTVLNGADGMGQLLAGLAGQAGQLMRMVQNSVNDLGTNHDGDTARGAVGPGTGPAAGPANGSTDS